MSISRNPGIIKGAATTALDIAGFVPTFIAETIIPSETIKNGIENHRTTVRRAAGAAVLGAVLLS